MSLDPHAARLLRMLASTPPSERALPSPSARCEALRGLAALTADPPDPRVAAIPVTYRRRGPKGPLTLRLYRPGLEGEDPRGLIVYLHGGGWVAGDLDTHDGVCRALAAASGCRTLAVDYRRAPEHRFPAAVDDAADVTTWVLANARRWGADPHRVVLAGDSAGGNLAAAAVMRLAPRDARALALLVLLCPILELADKHPSRALFAEGYFLKSRQMTQDIADYLTDPAEAGTALASPLRAPDLARFPPSHLHLAEFDPFRDEGLAFADRLRRAGVAVRRQVHAGMIHNFYALPKAIPYARTALTDIGAAIRDAVEGR